MLLGRLSDEDEAFLRKFLKELLNIEPTKILIFTDEDRKRLQAEDMDAYFEPETGRIFVQRKDRGLDLEALMHEATHMWKPNWSEEHVDEAARYLAVIFRVYENEERKPFEKRIVSEDKVTSHLDQDWEFVKVLSNGKFLVRRSLGA